MPEENKAAIRKFLEAFNMKDIPSLTAATAHDFFNHDPMPGMSPDQAGQMQTLQGS